MTRREDVIKGIKNLIEKYNSKDDAIIKDYSEANVRKDFIDLLFDKDILGWDVRDSAEYDAERYIRKVGYADVAIKVDNYPKIFVEAKKFGGVPSRTDRGVQTTLEGHKIHADWTDEERQVLNYAGADVGVKWAILTNFEKFRLFNAKTGETVLNLEKPEDYLERIDDILLLTKENVLNNNIDKLEDRIERPDVDDGFLGLIKKWQLKLANEIYSKDNKLDLKEINLYVQRILDRLVIVRYAEDNWILKNPDHLKALRDSALKSDYVSFSDLLINFFDGFDSAHDSKIFEKNDTIDEIIKKIDKNILIDLIGELYNQSFRKFTSDILGSTYEKYLSSELCIKDGEVKLQYRSQFKKNQGIFYTPPYIVDFIVSETLGKKLENLWECVSELYNQKEYNEAVSKFKEIYDIKVLDPSCGSGSFLIKAHDTFLKYYKKYEIEAKKAIKELKKQVNAEEDSWKLIKTIEEPLKNYERIILKKNLYGVDLDENAAEIASVNLMLRALKPNEKLPLILYENIKVGNSLITGVDDLEELEDHLEQIKLLMEFREKIKNTVDIEEKKLLEEEHDKLKYDLNEELNENLNDYFDDLSLVKPFNWEIEFPEVFYDSNGNLKDDSNFDVVIGNPPYFNIDTLGANSPEMKFIMNYFSDVWMDKSDILFYFIAKAIQLTKNDVGFIVSNAFMFADKARKLKNFILDHAPVSKIINFEKYMVFEEASITTAIVILNKLKEDIIANAISFKDSKYTEKEITDTILNESNYFEIEFKKDHNFALAEAELNELYDMIDDDHPKLIDLMLVGKGMETAADPVFLFDSYPTQFPPEFIKERVSGKNTERYFIYPATDYILYFEDIEKFQDLPSSIKTHLLENKKTLEERAEKKRNKSSKWWNYTFTLHKEYYSLPKLFSSRRAHENTFSFDEGFNYLSFSNMTVIFETNENYSIKYILALLNSNLLTFRYRNLGKQTGGGSFEYFPNGVGKLPIPEICLEDQEPFIELTDKIMNLKKQRNDILSSFKNLVEIGTDETFSFAPLDYYLKLNIATDYEINLSRTETFIDKNKEFIPKSYSVSKDEDSIYLNVCYIDGSEEDVLKINIPNPILREFFYISIYIATDLAKKGYRTNKNIYKTLVTDIRIPKFKQSTKKDRKIIESVMENLQENYNKDNYLDSSFKKPDITLINEKIREIDNQINSLVYKLYGMTDYENFIEENLN